MMFVRVVAFWCCLVLLTGPANAVVVSLTQIGEGEPVPGTTISLETTDGEVVPLEIAAIEEIELVEETPQTSETSQTDGGQEQATNGQISSEPTAPKIGGETEQAVTSSSEEETPKTGGEEEEKKENVVNQTVTGTKTGDGNLVADTPTKEVVSVLVNSDGTAQFIVPEKYENLPLVLVQKDADGNIVEKREVSFAAGVVTLAVSNLPIITPQTVADAAQTSAPSSASTSAQADSQPRRQTVSGAEEANPASYEENDYRYRLGFEYENGTLDRSRFNALRLQTGGVATQEFFASQNRNSRFDGFTLQTDVDLDRVFAPTNSNLYFSGSLRWATSSDSFDGFDVFSAQDLGILGPEGPTGPLAGGVAVPFTGGGNSNLNEVHYRDDYLEFLGHVGLMTMFEHNGFSITPSAYVFYGRTEEDIAYTGITNTNTLNFAYDVNTETDRLGVQLRLEIEREIADGIYLFGGGDARIIRNDAQARANLNTTGVLIASESADASSVGLDFGGVLEGGVRFKQDNVEVEFGGRFESWAVAVPQITGEAPLFISYEDRESTSVYGKIVIRY